MIYQYPIKRNNLHLVFGNIKKEKEGHAAIFEFEKFYTPEKEKQLLAEYEKTLAEKCVGCDYPEPLDVQRDSCDLCPNREYVDGKCVLKKDKKRKKYYLFFVCFWPDVIGLITCVMTKTPTR